MSQNSMDGFSKKSAKSPDSDPMKFFAIILQNMKNKPDVDWNLVAEKAGYSNANTAKVRYGQIMRKLQAKENGDAPSTPSPVKARAPKTPVGSGTNRSPNKVAKKQKPGSGSFDSSTMIKRERWEEQRGISSGMSFGGINDILGRAD